MDYELCFWVVNVCRFIARYSRYTGSVHLTSTGGDSALRDTIKKQMVSSHLKVNEASYTVMLSYENWYVFIRWFLIISCAVLDVAGHYKGL